MASCSKCGAELPPGATSCGNCGQPAVAPASQAGGTTGMDENVAGLLCYALGWVTGLIFFLIDKRPFVRFHAAQSIVVFGGLDIIWVVLVRVFFGSLGFGGWGVFTFGGLLLDAVRLLGFVLWIVLM